MTACELCGDEIQEPLRICQNHIREEVVAVYQPNGPGNGTAYQLRARGTLLRCGCSPHAHYAKPCPFAQGIDCSKPEGVKTV